MRGIEAQFLALQKGFNELILQHLLRPFDERELEVWLLSVSQKHISIVWYVNSELEEHTTRLCLCNLLILHCVP